MNEILTKREYELLQILSAENGYVSTEDLCTKMNISSRTLRDCVRGFRDGQGEKAGAFIESRPGQGYRLKIENKEKYYAFLKDMYETRNQSQYVIPGDPDGRVRYIIRVLLTEHAEIKTEVLSKTLYISRSTLAEDLKAVREQLAVYSLHLKTVPGKGIRIEGEEKDIRRAIAAYYFQDASFDAREVKAIVSAYFSEKDYQLISETVYTCLKENDYRIADDSFKNLIIHILIADQRIRDNTYIEDIDPEQQAELMKRREWKIAKEIYLKLSEGFNANVPESEICYATIHLIGKRMIQNEEEMILYPQTLNLMTKLLQRIQSEFSIDFTGDIELFSGFAMHLQSTLERAKYGLHVNNPILADIRQNHPTALDIAVFAADVISAETGLHIQENEIGFMALHFALAMERQKLQRKKRIAIICASGAGISKMIAHQFRKKFRDTAETIDTMSYYDLQNNPECDYDLILSTVPIYFKVTAPVIRINQIPNDTDYDKVEAAINADDNDLELLCSCFDPDLFFVRQVKTPEEAIRFLCAEMRRKYELSSDFEERVIAREKMSPTAIGNRIAFPHPNKLTAAETKAAVLKLPEKILWNGEKVQLVILASLQKEDNRIFRLFSGIMSDFISDRRLVDRLIESPDYMTLRECFNELNPARRAEEEDIFQ